MKWYSTLVGSSHIWMEAALSWVGPGQLVESSTESTEPTESLIDSSFILKHNTPKYQLSCHCNNCDICVLHSVSVRFKLGGMKDVSWWNLESVQQQTCMWAGLTEQSTSSSIKTLHNVAKYTRVVKNYQTIYKYLSGIYFSELLIFLD